jgi:hypothetical protein
MTPSSLLPPSLDIASTGPSHAFGSESGVLIACWRGEIEMEHVQNLLKYRDEMRKRHFVGAIHMGEEGLKLPPADVRAAGRAGVEARGDLKPGIALVIFGGGFGASAIRSVATAIFTLRAGPPTRIFSDSKSAALWMAERAAPLHLDAGRLVAACEAIRLAAR